MISEFDVRFKRFNTQCNKIKIKVSDQIITSYYIYAFRNWDKNE